MTTTTTGPSAVPHTLARRLCALENALRKLQINRTPQPLRVGQLGNAQSTTDGVSVADGSILTYDAATGTYKNGTPGTAYPSLSYIDIGGDPTHPALQQAGGFYVVGTGNPAFTTRDGIGAGAGVNVTGGAKSTMAIYAGFGGEIPNYPFLGAFIGSQVAQDGSVRASLASSVPFLFPARYPSVGPMAAFASGIVQYGNAGSMFLLVPFITTTDWTGGTVHADIGIGVTTADGSHVFTAFAFTPPGTVGIDLPPNSLYTPVASDFFVVTNTSSAFAFGTFAGAPPNQLGVTYNVTNALLSASVVVNFNAQNVIA